MTTDFFSFYSPVPPSRPKMPLRYVVYMCYENSLVKGRLGSSGAYLKSNFIARYFAFEGQTSHFDAYVLCIVTSD